MTEGDAWGRGAVVDEHSGEPISVSLTRHDPVQGNRVVSESCG